MTKTHEATTISVDAHRYNNVQMEGNVPYPSLDGCDVVRELGICWNTKPAKVSKSVRVSARKQRKRASKEPARIEVIVQAALQRNDNNVIQRHQTCTSASDLTRLDEKLKDQPTFEVFLPSVGNWRCYMCRNPSQTLHNEYVFCCKPCGDVLKEYRYLSTCQVGKVALVTGARTKLGYQVGLKLLRAGAVLVGTTREPDRGIAQYAQEPDYHLWKDRLYIKKLDFLSQALEKDVSDLETFIRERFGRLDILVNNAAQTIRKPDITPPISQLGTNRYGDPAHYPPGASKSSWMLGIKEVCVAEFEEIFKVNSIGPALLVAKFADLMLQCEDHSYIINVHAREGLFNVRKAAIHFHTNMAKAALAMLTNCLGQRGPSKRIRIHGVDPGWISIDEYLPTTKLYAPLDEVDGAAKILYPLFMKLPTNIRTRRHYDQLLF